MSADEVLNPLLTSVREFARRHIDACEIDLQQRIPDSVFFGLKELGLFGCSLPTEWGGAGLSAHSVVRIIALLAETDRSVATTLGLHLGLGTRGLVAFGTASQKERWLPSLATGEAISAFSTTEPNAGSDLSRLETVVTSTSDGQFRLSGSKLYVTNGGFASLLTVAASSPGLGNSATGTSLLLVEPTAAGVHRQSEERKLGLKGSSTTGFIFDDVALTPDAMLGKPGEGTTSLKHILSWGRLLLSAGCVGTARSAFRAALNQTHHRRQFRKALIQQPVVQQQLAWSNAVLWGMTALVDSAAQAERHWPTLARLTTSAKVFCSEGAWGVVDTALQLHGGSGYIEDVGLALLLRDSRVTRIFEGANDVLLTHAGLMELTEPQPAPSSTTEVASMWRDVEMQRDALKGNASQLSLRCLGLHAQHHALGQSVVWRDAAAAATRQAVTREEKAAASLLCQHASVLARRTPHVAVAAPELVASLLEGDSL